MGSPLDALCAHLERLLKYSPGEMDAIFLHHFIGIEWPDKRVGTESECYSFSDCYVFP